MPQLSRRAHNPELDRRTVGLFTAVSLDDGRSVFVLRARGERDRRELPVFETAIALIPDSAVDIRHDVNIAVFLKVGDRLREPVERFVMRIIVVKRVHVPVVPVNCARESKRVAELADLFGKRGLFAGVADPDVHFLKPLRDVGSPFRSEKLAGIPRRLFPNPIAIEDRRVEPVSLKRFQNERPHGNAVAGLGHVRSRMRVFHADRIHTGVAADGDAFRHAGRIADPKKEAAAEFFVVNRAPRRRAPAGRIVRGVTHVLSAGTTQQRSRAARNDEADVLTGGIK